MMHQALPFFRSKFVFQAQETFSGGGDVGDVERGEPGREFLDDIPVYMKSAFGLQGNNSFLTRKE